MPQDSDLGNYHSIAELVLEAAAIDVADVKTSEAIKALLVTRGELDRGELKSYCQSGLAAYKVPRRLRAAH